ncbi:hypothetical protein BBJ29_000454 [Phytophthora kernoviae]|uniref:Uncharacterized protein n=1 Tax=Phytophthora kernoviae TaxID=325452 RepID=A0A3F2RT64_9STRA|nr:hypothetical protein BBJ29_000454 [Phytophthora kernoviae]RLN63295.1 hypothetical protein BBP00_00004229 [Phytophthora kernoviae]
MDRQDEESESQFARLNDVCFPDEITALVHVLEQIDELLMLPREALAKAVEAENLQWLAFLLHKFGFDPLDSVASAAANGRLDSVIFLLSKASGGENNGNPDEEEDSESDDDSEDSESDDDETSEGEEQDDRQMQRVLKKATVRAAKNGHVAVVEFLLSKIADGHEDDRIPTEVVSEAIKKVANKGDINIVEFLFDNAAIPDDVKQEAIVSAAGCSQNEVVQFMCNSGDWPLHVLKEALNVANDSKLKEYLHEKVTKA